MVREIHRLRLYEFGALRVLSGDGGAERWGGEDDIPQTLKHESVEAGLLVLEMQVINACIRY